NTNDNTLEFSSGNVVFGNGAVGQDTFYLDVAIDETTVNYTPIQLSSCNSQTLYIDSSSVLNVEAFGTTSQNKTWYILYCTGKAAISGSFGNPGGPTDWLSEPTFSQTASAITMTGTP